MEALTLSSKAISKFLSKVKVDSSTGCHNFMGSTNHFGYGQIMVDRKLYLTHRLAWIIANGSVPEDMCVLHKCDNPQCINIEHLFLGTRVDNIEDMDSKNRGVKGVKHHNVRFTEEQVVTILKLYHSGSRDIKNLAIAYNVSNSTIWAIVRGYNWKHIYETFTYR